MYIDSRFLSNIYDPNRPDFDDMILSENFGKRKKREKTKVDDVPVGKVSRPPSKEEAVKYVRRWLVDKTIGDPQPPKNSEHTVESLKALGYVGIYISAEAERGHKHCGPSLGGFQPYDKEFRIDSDYEYDDVPAAPSMEQ